jgi:hypothetical protein
MQIRKLKERGKAMRTFSILLSLAFVFACGTVSAATLFAEDFNYPTGMLKNVSGGVWDTWLGTSQDMVVVSNMLVSDGQNVPEVVAYYQNALPGVGWMNAKFSFFVHEEGQTDTDSYLWIGGGKDATKEIDYNIWGFIMDWGVNNSIGSTELHLWDVDGNDGGGDWGIALLGSGLPLNTWHTVELYAQQTVADPLANANAAADGQFQVWLDGNLVMGWTNFGNNSANGVNSVDIYSMDDGNEHDFFAYDKIYIESSEPNIPEPSIFALAGLGLLMLIRRRK